MELDNIIYIIITITIFVVSLLGQSRRKKFEKQQVNDEVQYSLNDFEKILLRKEEFRSSESIVEKSELSELKSENDPIAEKNDPKPPIHSLNQENDSDDGFDFKTAITYSSILERKKFRR